MRTIAFNKKALADEREKIVMHNFKLHHELQNEIKQLQAELAVEWIIRNMPQLTFSSPGKILKLAYPDTGSLGEFEDYGRAGNAIQIHRTEHFIIWWLDPAQTKEEDIFVQKFALTAGDLGGVVFEVHFSQSSDG